MLSQAAICAAVQRVARARHESDDTAILARAVLQLLRDVERLRIDDRTLAAELRRNRTGVKKLRPKGKVSAAERSSRPIRIAAE